MSTYDDATMFDVPSSLERVDEQVWRHLIQNHEFLFFSKAQAWSYERELRFLVVARSGAEFKLDITDFLRGVVIGEDFPKAYMPSLKAALEGLAVDVQHIRWDQGVPNIVPVA